jgi:two-component system, chemotaxis family, sensor kinase Cph1
LTHISTCVTILRNVKVIYIPFRQGKLQKSIACNFYFVYLNTILLDLLATDHDNPIHIPGSIQPHGVLLAFSTQLQILQVSNNTREYLGKRPQELLGKYLSCLFNAEQLEAIQQCLREDFGGVNYLDLSLATSEGERYFDGFLHQTSGIVILELELTDSCSSESFSSVHTLTKGAIAKLKRASELKEFLQLTTSELRKIAGFDHVMVYKFDHDQAGEVIAEAKREDLPSYLGLRYPNFDIPEPARELYKRSLLRFIPNFAVESVELQPKENPVTHEPLDLSLSVLRSFGSCCAEYHQNMDTAALLVISIIKDSKLWGLISFHHQTPKYIPYKIRASCEFLGEVISLELANKVIQEKADYKTKLESLRSQVMESISQQEDLVDALIQPEARLLELVGASGVAVCINDDITLRGKTPNIQNVRSLITWVETQGIDNIFYTNCLAKIYPEAIAFKDIASGLLLLQISRIRQYYILWFRPEVIQTVNWAGNPQENIQLQEDGSIKLSPRKSFEKWQEIVQLTSEPWKDSELDSALSIRSAIIGIVIKKAEELAKINLELERSNLELASFAYAASHDLKEPLRGIYNFSTILQEDYSSVLDDEGLECIETVLSLSVRMENLINALLRLSQLGQAQLQMQETNLNELVQEVIEVFHASRQQNLLDIRVPRFFPTIECDQILLNEVFSNLIANAFKYNDKPEPWVEIGYLTMNEQQEIGLIPKEQTLAPLVFYVQDNGIGIPQHHHKAIFKIFKRLHSQEKYGGGAGAGLAIARKIVERHGGTMWVESTFGVGSTFYFTLTDGC